MIHYIMKTCPKNPFIIICYTPKTKTQHLPTHPSFCRAAVAIDCYVCNATDSASPFQCGEWFERFDMPDIKPQSCAGVHGAKYCIKHIGRFEGNPHAALAGPPGTLAVATNSAVSATNGNGTHSHNYTCVLNN